MNEVYVQAGKQPLEPGARPNSTRRVMGHLGMSQERQRGHLEALPSTFDVAANTTPPQGKAEDDGTAVLEIDLSRAMIGAYPRGSPCVVLYLALTWMTRVPQFCSPSGVWLDGGGIYSVAIQKLALSGERVAQE